MAQILVRDLEESLLKRLKKRARVKGRSLQAEVKLILVRAVSEPKVDMKAARKLSEKFRKIFKGRTFPDTAELIKDDRGG